MSSRGGPASAAARRGLLRGLVVLVHIVLLSGALGGLLGELRLLLGAAGLLGLELRGDGGVVLGAQVDLFGGAGAFAVGLELVLPLEGLDLLNRHFKLVGDPCVSAALADPPADLIQLRTQRPATHGGRGD